jgi:hypothetical protein
VTGSPPDPGRESAFIPGCRSGPLTCYGPASSALNATGQPRAVATKGEAYPVLIDKAEVVAILRSRGLHARADWVDRELPPIIDANTNGSLLRMLDVDLGAVAHADPGQQPSPDTSDPT